MPEWDNVVGSMIERFGKEERTVGVMLQFLKCLVEEAGNPRVPMNVSALLVFVGVANSRRMRALRIAQRLCLAPVPVKSSVCSPCTFRQQVGG
jgi:hypothetical protein